MSVSSSRGHLTTFAVGFAAALALLLALQLTWAGGRSPAHVAEAGRTPGMDPIPENITTGGSEYDPTILTEFIPGSAFYPSVALNPSIGQCVYSPGPTGFFHAPVALPDGARIKRVRFYGRDNNGAESVEASLYRAEVSLPTNVLGGGDPTTDDKTVVAETDSSSESGEFVIATEDDLAERTGSFNSFSGGTITSRHRFHAVEVHLTDDQRICGVEVDFQIPTTPDLGAVFHPVSPYRAYDSRLEMSPVPDGRISAGASRLVPVGRSRDVSTGSLAADDELPAGTTAVAYTVTVVETSNPGFLFVAPGDATEITASTVNWGATPDGAIANSSTVSVDELQQIAVFGGGPGSSAHFIIDIIGYYAAPVLPNMAG